ncbi:MAG: Hsp33 family molecular chaperone HslO [Fusobacteriaceae bacterium]|jgi:molecular chaperone Hsp33|nr:Hsp33 family molecular chaperone HslO [Fusobacteriaceae bacterium]
MGKLLRGISKNAKFVICDTTDIVARAKDIHECAPTTLDAFGRMLTAGVMMASYLKGSELMTLKTESDGPLKAITVTADAAGAVKGFASDPGADLPRLEDGRYNVPALVGNGYLRVMKDLGLKEPYVGISELVSGGIAKDLAYYYFTSEQTPTVISVSVHLSPEGAVLAAGGYLVQLLPGAEESFITALEQKIDAILEITELLEGGMSLRDIAELLYDDMGSEPKKRVEDFEILEEKSIEYRCNCSRERFRKGLAALGKTELRKIFLEEKEEKLEVVCQFCKTKYYYKADDFKTFLED